MKSHPNFLNAGRYTTPSLWGIVALYLLPTTTMAAQTLISDDVKLTVGSFMVGSRFTPPIDNRGPLRAPFGAPVELEAYVGTKNFQEFIPFEGFHFFGIKDAFASAQINANGAGGVGISGRHETLQPEHRDDARMTATAVFNSTLRNIGDSGGPVDFTFQIPRVELAVSPETDPLDATTPFEVFLTAFFTVKHFAAPDSEEPGDTGALKNEFFLFDYSIDYSQAPEVENLVVSADLLADAGPVLAPSACRACIGLRFDPFEVTKTVVDDLLPNERLEYEYWMVVFTNFFGTAGLDGQAGAAVFYGDPLEITGRSSFEIHNLTPAPVPLPGTLGLLLPGLWWLRRQTRAMTT